MYQVHVVDLNPILPLSSRRRLVPPRRKDTSVSELAKQSHNPSHTKHITQSISHPTYHAPLCHPNFTRYVIPTQEVSHNPNHIFSYKLMSYASLTPSLTPSHPSYYPVMLNLPVLNSFQDFSSSSYLTPSHPSYYPVMLNLPVLNSFQDFSISSYLNPSHPSYTLSC